jgi:hypothetical protein
MTDDVDYLIVAAIGGVVGASELLDRFRRGESAGIFKHLATWLYILLNALAGALALLLIAGLGLTTSKSSDPSVIRWSRVIIAGFGAVLILRSSAVLPGSGKVKGPGAVVQRILDAVVHRLDSTRGIEREQAIDELIVGLDYSHVRDNVVATVLRMFPQTAGEQRDEVTAAVEDADRLALGDTAKTRAILQAIIAFGGTAAVKRAVQSCETAKETA